MKRIFLLAMLTALAMLMAAPAVAEWRATGNLPCAKMHTEGDGTYNPELVLSNGCGDVVFWAMCINYPSKVDNDYYDGALQPGTQTSVETYPEVGEEFGIYVHFQTMSPEVEYPDC